MQRFQSINQELQKTGIPTVLIADDDEPTRILLRSSISQWGYKVIEASDGEEAWNILQRPKPPKILILDWLMPRLDGITLCERIRQKLDFYPYIIFLTRMSGTENILKGFEAGADEFLLKPFNPSELRIRIFAGERIIKYQDMVEEKNKQLQYCFSKMEMLKDRLEGIHDSDALQQIEELKVTLSHIMEDIKKQL